jgi:hypothetical protein
VPEPTCACAVPTPQKLSRGVYCADCALPILGAVTDETSPRSNAAVMRAPVELSWQNLNPAARYAMIVLDGAQDMSSQQVLGVSDAWRKFVEGEVRTLIVDARRYAIVEVPAGVTLEPLVARRADPKNPKVSRSGDVIAAGAIPHPLDRAHAVRWVAELRAFLARDMKGDLGATEGPDDPVRESMRMLRDMRAETRRLGERLEKAQRAKEPKVIGGWGVFAAMGTACLAAILAALVQLYGWFAR